MDDTQKSAAIVRAPRLRRGWGTLQQKWCWTPTWRGWLLLFAFAIALLIGFGACIHPFLAQSAPVRGEVLVIEGWAPDYALEHTVRIFRSNGYRKLYVTGCPLDAGAALVEYRTYAERGAAILVKLGVPPESVQAVPAPLVRQDRTYTSAVALKQLFDAAVAWPKSLDVVSMGPHSRRSRVLFAKALGDRVAVGVISVEIKDYDPRRWWTSSAGVNAITDETIGYLYARFWFHPKT